jgi:sulfate permease, SulP family
MAERHEFLAILKRSRGEALVLLTTFLLTVFRDLTEGILAGLVLGSFLFMHRMAELVAVESGAPMLEEDEADTTGRRPAYRASEGADRDVMVYRFAGPLFFGAASTIAAVLERIGQVPKTVILDLSAVPLADSTAAASLKGFAERAHRYGGQVYVTGATRPVRRVLLHQGLRRPLARFAPSVAEARMAAGLHPGPAK